MIRLSFTCPKQNYGILSKRKPDTFGGMTMETYFYVVESIDGDYANLRRTDVPSDDLKLVARALLPEEIREGSRLKYEMFEYSLID